MILSKIDNFNDIYYQLFIFSSDNIGKYAEKGAKYLNIKSFTIAEKGKSYKMIGNSETSDLSDK